MPQPKKSKPAPSTRGPTALLAYYGRTFPANAIRCLADLRHIAEANHAPFETLRAMSLELYEKEKRVGTQPFTP